MLLNGDAARDDGAATPPYQAAPGEDYDAPAPVLTTAVTQLLLAAGYPLSVYAGAGVGYTPGPFLDWSGPALVHVGEETGGRWHRLPVAAQAAVQVTVGCYADILTAGGLAATVETYPDGRPYVAVHASDAPGVV